MQNTQQTERFPPIIHNAPMERRLTPKVGILVGILVGAALWAQLGGITMATTVSIVITIPAWIMFLVGLALIIAVVFVTRYKGDYVFGRLGDEIGAWMHDEERMW